MSTGKGTQQWVERCVAEDPHQRLKIIQVPDPVVITSRYGSRISGRLSEKRTVDFVGWLRGAGKTLLLEAKETGARERWTLDKRLRGHQLGWLMEVAQDGGLAAIFLRNTLPALGGLPGGDYLIPVGSEGLPRALGGRGGHNPPASVQWSKLAPWKIPPRRIWVDALVGKDRALLWQYYTEGGWGELGKAY